MSRRQQVQLKSFLGLSDRDDRAGARAGIGPGSRGALRFGPRGGESPGAPHRARELPFCAIEEELRAALVDEMPIHPVPEEPRDRKGPFGISTIVHVLLILALIFESKLAHESRSEVKPDITIQFKEPIREPADNEKTVMPPAPRAKPDPRPTRPPAPAPPEAKPREERQSIPPPAVPKEIPPPQPMPEPKRMGELVPVPHLPVPGTVPPEEGKTGKPGPPQPERTPQELSGDENGTSDTDRGFGQSAGAGAGGAERPPDTGSAVVKGQTTGNLIVPRPKGGLQSGADQEGGGRRRGLNLELPPESGAFGDFAFDDKDYDWSDYYSQMYWSIWRAWHNRLYVMTPIFERWTLQHHARGMKGSVLIRFVIERSGSIATIEVLEPSTLSPLDDSAQSALKEVILPRLPEDFPKESEGVSGRFLMDVDDLDSFKYGLRVMKYRGIF